MEGKLSIKSNNEECKHQIQQAIPALLNLLKNSEMRKHFTWNSGNFLDVAAGVLSGDSERLDEIIGKVLEAIITVNGKISEFVESKEGQNVANKMESTMKLLHDRLAQKRMMESENSELTTVDEETLNDLYNQLDEYFHAIHDILCYIVNCHCYNTDEKDISEPEG